MNGIKISNNELREKNYIDIDGKASEFSKPSFWYYTTLDTAKKIFAGKQIYVNAFADMNDITEANIHEDLSKNVHALCFCNSNTEKIPMWYLYAGLSGEGVSIGFTPAKMLVLIKSIETVTCVDTQEKLYKGVDFDIDYGWIYYRDSDRRIHYRNKWYEFFGDTQAFEKDNYFVKQYPWEYEKEFRIIINTRNKVGKVAIDIPKELMPEIKIKFGPEMDEKNIKKEILHCKELKKCKKKQILYSKLNIKMALYERNMDGLVKYVSKIIEEKPDNEIIEDLKKCLGMGK